MNTDEDKPLNALEIHNAPIEDILTEQIETPNTAEVESPPTDVAPETPPTPPVEEPIAPVINPEELKIALKEDLTKEISEDVTKKIMDALSPERDQTVKPPWETENRSPTYQEAIDWATKQGLEGATPDLVQKIKDEVKADLQKEVEDEQTQAEQIKAQEQEQIKGWESNWNSDFADLESKGLLPKANVEDRRVDESGKYLDPGMRARQEVFAAMQRNIVKIQGEGRAATPTDYSAKVAFYEGYKPANEQPAGANAPVYGAHKSSSGSSNGSFSYAEIHNTPVETLLSESQH